MNCFVAQWLSKETLNVYAPRRDKANVKQKQFPSISIKVVMVNGWNDKSTKQNVKDNLRDSKEAVRLSSPTIWHTIWKITKIWFWKDCVGATLNLSFRDSKIRKKSHIFNCMNSVTFALSITAIFWNPAALALKGHITRPVEKLTRFVSMSFIVNEARVR